jgi:hypothetical protein
MIELDPDEPDAFLVEEDQIRMARFAFYLRYEGAIKD